MDVDIFDPTSKMTIRNNAQVGMFLAGVASVQTNGTLFIENNNSVGLLLQAGSEFHNVPPASTTVSGNRSTGISANQNSTLALFGGSLTVSGNQGAGISIFESSVLKANAGSLLVENNTGTNADGIYLSRSSNASLQALSGSTLSVKIQNNGAGGITMYQQSSGRFDVTTEMGQSGFLKEIVR